MLRPMRDNRYSTTFVSMVERVPELQQWIRELARDRQTRRHDPEPWMVRDACRLATMLMLRAHASEWIALERQIEHEIATRAD